MIKQAVKVTLADDVVKQIGDMIQSGAWPSGYQLPPERQLVEQFGVSRNTLREALKALNLLGLQNAHQVQRLQRLQPEYPAGGAEGAEPDGHFGVQAGRRKFRQHGY